MKTQQLDLRRLDLYLTLLASITAGRSQLAHMHLHLDGTAWVAPQVPNLMGRSK